ncbi:MAG: hypothetical protein BLITH_1330 [Brockia lithotrophica]|uniref:Stage III sporulation protein AC n=1 Tax=Brockia lithotrophica TaxID=933949 RepID=A0A2T5G690_9BACL|nr:stage III sporulation protein AC [Brockia lithotrophica]MBT9252391.1 stage III sporulation protein AC [Brockia lithotrophica]MBT9252765.1 stage III sporulation protein AC [Brockia lithotrophica]PTQ51692.1 MAG: hypothetical protein BLITH_1330 [Brockia lithotrophica]
MFNALGLDVHRVLTLAAFAILLSIVHAVLKQAGKEEWAQLITYLGFLAGLYLVVDATYRLFAQLERLFRL